MVVAASSAISRIDWVSVPAMCGLRIDVGEAEERVAGLGWLVVEHVQARPGEMARDQGVAQVGFDDQPAARRIDEVRARPHLGQEVAVDHAAGRFGQRQVQADDVRARQQLVERQPVDSVPLVEFGVEDRVERDDPHPERQGAQGHRPADPAHADQAQRHAPDRCDQRAVPAAAVNARDRWGRSVAPVPAGGPRSARRRSPGWFPA